MLHKAMKISLPAAIAVCAIFFVPFAGAVGCNLLMHGDFTVSTRAVRGGGVKLSLPQFPPEPLAKNELGWIRFPYGTRPDSFTPVPIPNSQPGDEKVFQFQVEGPGPKYLKEDREITITTDNIGSGFTVDCESCATKFVQPKGEIGKNCRIQLIGADRKFSGRCVYFAGTPGVAMMAPCGYPLHRLSLVDVYKA